MLHDALDVRKNKKVWQSYVYHGKKCFFVSTIERTYDIAAAGSEGMRGEETLVWEYDHEIGERGKMIGHMGGVVDHQRICRCLLSEGVMLDEGNEAHKRFLR